MNILNAVIAHKDFEWNDISDEDLEKYLVFTPNDIKTNLPNIVKYKEIEGYDNRLYSELSHHKYIKENVDFDWIVINHYRRILQIPNYDNVFVPAPMKFKESVKKIYSYFHDIKDLDLMTEIIMNSEFEDCFKLEWLKSLDDKCMICYNMFSGPKILYEDWLNTCLSLLDKFKKIRNFTDYDAVVKHYKTFYENKEDTETHDPYRVYAFLCERITNCYFRWYSKTHNDILNMNHPIFPCNVKLLEEDMII